MSQGGEVDAGPSQEMEDPPCWNGSSTQGWGCPRLRVNPGPVQLPLKPRVPPSPLLGDLSPGSRPPHQNRFPLRIISATLYSHRSSLLYSVLVLKHIAVSPGKKSWLEPLPRNVKALPSGLFAGRPQSARQEPCWAVIKSPSS